MTLNERLTKVRQAVRRLQRVVENDMGPRARRSARSELARALRRLRAEAEALCPPPPRKPAQRLDPRVRANQMRKDGWDDLTMNPSALQQRIIDLAHRGIRVVRVKVPITDGLGRNTGSHHQYIFAPPWTKGVPTEKLSAARKSHRASQAIKAVTKLTAGATP